MEQLIKELAAYNNWANHKMTEWVNQLTEDQFEKEIVSSFSSIKKTCMHIWSAQEVWICRLEGIGFDTKYLRNESITRTNLMNNIMNSSNRLKIFSDKLSETDLQKDLNYQNLKGENFSNKIYGVLTHVFNHSTFHRGQLVTMLRQAGFTELSSTDLISFFRI